MKAFENIVGKGENASTPSKTEIIILATVDLSSANSFNFVKANFSRQRTL